MINPHSFKKDVEEIGDQKKHLAILKPEKPSVGKFPAI